MARLFKWWLLAFGLLIVLIFVAAAVAALRGSIRQQSILHVTLDGPLREAPDAEIWSLLDDSAGLTLYEVTDSLRREWNV